MSSWFGGFTSGVTSWEQGKEQWKQAKRSMQYQEESWAAQNEYSQRKSAEETRREENRLAEILGTQKAAYGASGVKTTEGSPMDVMLATEREGNNQIAYRSYMEQFQRDYEQAMHMHQLYETQQAGRLAKKAGAYAMYGSWMAGTGQVGSSIGNYFMTSGGSDGGGGGSVLGGGQMMGGEGGMMG